MQFLGLCGRYAKKACKIAWSSAFGTKIGTYPKDMLPTQMTIWYASGQGTYSFSKPVVDPGSGGTIGLGIIAGLTSRGLGVFQEDVFRPITTLVFSFARTANRVNVEHKITQAEIDAAKANNGILELDLKEYVFEVLGVTDAKIEVVSEASLTQEQKDDIKKNNDTVDDYLFRTMLSQGISADKNRLIELIANKEGIEYRMDNGTALASQILDNPGTGDLNSATYRDGTATKIKIDFNKPKTITTGATGPQGGTGPASTTRPLQKDDILYIHYIAVLKHYFRQLIKVSWFVVARQGGGIIEAYAYPTKVTAMNYRFYTWDIDAIVNGKITTKKLSGWRAVESSNANPYIGFVNDSKLILSSDTPRTVQSAKNTSYVPKDVTNNQYADAIEHVYYNVSAEALKKPDIYKYGLERSLAEEIQTRIGTQTSTVATAEKLNFPFLDDTKKAIMSDINNNVGVYVTNGTITPSNYTMLTNANFKLDLMTPSVQYGTYLGEIDVGVTGGVLLTSDADNVQVFYTVTSPIIREQMAKDTKILMERFATYGERGQKVFSIQAMKALEGPQVSCLIDPMGTTTSLVHSNEDSNLAYHSYDNSLIGNAFSVLDYKPYTEVSPVPTASAPTIEDSLQLTGYTRMMGANPGYNDGRTVSTANFISLGNFTYYVSDENAKKKLPSVIKPEAVKDVTITKNDSLKITLPSASAFYGETRLYYKYKTSNKPKNSNLTAYYKKLANKELKPEELMMIFRDGQTMKQVIDQFYIKDTTKDPNGVGYMVLSHPWVKCNEIEIIGNKIEDMSDCSVIVLQMNEDKATDFLTGAT